MAVIEVSEDALRTGFSRTRRPALSTEIAERVAELRQQGRTPKEIARALGLKPAEVAPFIRAIGAASPKREAPLAGCWVTDHWSHKLTVRGHEDWPGMSQPGPEAGALGLVAVLVARETGSTVAACGYLVDVWCLGVKDTLGPKTMDRRKLPEFTRLFFRTSSGSPVQAPLELARHVVFGAADYARGLGFDPHPDFAKGARLLGEWEPGSSDVTFGRDGKPMFINGPHDDTFGVLAKLRTAVGDGNYDSLIQSGPRQIS
ncbi:MAG TPA: helix-turn-helix domain-containing protein [Trebonia sp.]|nr:helix-turn-helix domain-containing protein [Trebonia sp.]